MANQLTPAMQQYQDFKDQHKDAVLFFQLGDFYEMFGEDAVEVSRWLDITLTSRNKGKENELAMCGVPLKAATGYIAKLTQMGKKVVIVDQVSKPDGKGVVEREVAKIVTPGTTFDEELLNQKESNFLCAVEIGKEEYAFGVVDVTTGNFQVALFSSAQQLLDEIHRINPSEILIEDIEHELLQPVKEHSFLAQFGLPAWKDPKIVILEHFKTLGLESFGIEEKPLLQSVVANLLSYLQETQRSQLGHIRTIEQYQAGDWMLLDEATIRNLELFANQQTGDTEGSLIGVLDETVTSMGGRLLRWWLAHPLINEAKIIQRHEVVGLFKQDKELLQVVQESLIKICDLERLVGKVGTMRVNPRDLSNLKESLLLLPQIKYALKDHLKDLPLLSAIYTQIDEQKELIAIIEKTLKEEPPVLMQEGGYIKDGFNAELDELRTLSTSGKDWISNLQEEEKKRTGISSLKIKYNRVFGYYIEVSKANAGSVPENYIRKQTLVNAERYITPELKEYEEKVLGAQDKIVLLEEELFHQLKISVYELVDSLQKTARALAELDVLVSFAYLANKRNYVQPHVVATSELSIKEGRHPVIEALQKEPYIPNDLEIHDSVSIHLLTGPNMSGKSSFLRQNALIVLLAQIGSFVPAKEMNWSIVDRVFTRVGASDNLARGRSTFMVEMQEAGYILNNASSQSLIILDELGRGTSTYDGLSLAWAITEYLHDVLKAKTLFATHYHELIEIADDLPRAKNYSVTVAGDGDSIVFLHKVKAGGIDQSYGIEVAKLAGLPNPLILRAKDILAKLEQHAWEKDSASRQPSLPLMPVSKPTEHPVIQKLKEIDPHKVTPMQALQLLDELKNEID